MGKNDHSNPGIVDIEKARSSFEKAGYEENVKTRPDGTKHHTYHGNEKDNERRFSYDEHPDGTYSKLHSTNSSNEHMTYTGGGK